MTGDNDILKSRLADEELERTGKLDIAWLSLDGLEPIAHMYWVSELDCGSNEIRSLEQIISLKKLKSLECSSNSIQSLEPISGLIHLTNISFNYNEVQCLVPLQGMEQLVEIYSIGNPIQSLQPISKLARLGKLICFDCNQIEIPNEILSKDYYDNCLPRVRAYYSDLEFGEAALNQHKIIILGNGRVGKTQLAGRLFGKEFDENSVSTHGIQIISNEIKFTNENDETKIIDFRLWDFGGQDIYHSTHALFMRTNAVFVICWNEEEEERRPHTIDGIEYQNFPIEYWINYVRQMAGEDAPIIIVETKRDEGKPSNFPNSLPQNTNPIANINFSARTGDGEPELKDAIYKGIESLGAKNGEKVIGLGPSQIIKTIENWVNEDSERPISERTHQTINVAEFNELCAENGKVTSPEHLLDFLHNIGLVFHLKGSDEGKIIIDQAWALDAIYSVFHRQSAYKEIVKNGGRFTKSDLAQSVWKDYSIAEQELFIGMMQTCEIAFKYSDKENSETIYIAPDLLPNKSSESVRQFINISWDENRPTQTRAIKFELLHKGIMRGIIKSLAQTNPLNTTFWRGGIMFCDTVSQSVCMIEEYVNSGEWAGEIRISTQKGDNQRLAEDVENYFWQICEKQGIRPKNQHARAKYSSEKQAHGLKEEFNLANRTGTNSYAKSAWYISYPWGDDSEEGREHERQIEEICETIRNSGIEIVRDKTHMKYGDSINKFVNDIAESQNVIVIMNEKYLKSAFCMTELHGIWKNHSANPETFAKAVKAFCKSDIDISKMENRIKYSSYWIKQVQDWEAIFKEGGPKAISEKDFISYKQMDKLIGILPDVLTYLDNTLRPTQWEDFVEYVKSEIEKYE